MSPSTAQRGRGAGRARTASSASPPIWRSWLLWVVIGAIVLAGGIAVAISSGGGNEAQAGEVADEVTIQGSDLPPLPTTGDDPAVGEPAPGVKGTAPGTNDSVTYKPGGGTPSVVFILAHYCPHCQAEVPRIVDLADAGGTEGVDVTAITTGTDPDLPNYPPSAWLEREDWPFPVIADTKNQDAGLAFGLTAYPFMVFVDADGDVAGRITGEVSEEGLALLFKELRKGQQLSIPSAGGSTPSG